MDVADPLLDCVNYTGLKNYGMKYSLVRVHLLLSAKAYRE